MSDINVFVDDQQMTITNNPVIASGGVNEDYVVFTFSEEWDDFEKVACFYKDGEEENIVEMIIDENNKALIPHEVTDEPGKFWFGVVGINNDITYTSEVLWYDLRKGIYEKESRGATADIYVQMLQLAQEIVNHLNNTPYTTVEEDGEFELPIHTIKDSVISAESTWSSEKIKAEYPIIEYYLVKTMGVAGFSVNTDVKYAELDAMINSGVMPQIKVYRNNTTDHKETYLVTDVIRSAGTYTEIKLKAISKNGYIEITHKNDDTKTAIENFGMMFGTVFKNMLSGHIEKETLDDYTAFNVYLGKCRYTDYQYGYFKALDEYLDGHLNAIDVPYTVEFTGDSLTDATSRTEIKKLDLTFGKFKVQKNENNEYLLYLDWYVKSGVTYNLPNGIYINVYPFFRPIYTD